MLGSVDLFSKRKKRAEMAGKVEPYKQSSLHEIRNGIGVLVNEALPWRLNFASWAVKGSFLLSIAAYKMTR